MFRERARTSRSKERDTDLDGGSPEFCPPQKSKGWTSNTTFRDHLHLRLGSSVGPVLRPGVPTTAGNHGPTGPPTGSGLSSYPRNSRLNACTSLSGQSLESS